MDNTPASRHSPLTTVLDALERVTGEAPKREGNSYRALCPAHDDHTPSLGVGLSEKGAVLLSCRSQGCEASEIVEALGLHLHDLFPPDGKRREEDIAPTGAVSEEDREALRAYVEAGQASDTAVAFGMEGQAVERMREYAIRTWGLDITEVGGFWDRGDRGTLPRPSFLTLPPRMAAVFPFRSFDGQVTGLQARDPRPGEDGRRWYGPSGSGWARHNWVRPNPDDDERTPIVICEGTSDTLAVAAAGLIACGVRGAALTPKSFVSGVRRVAGRRRVVVIGDNDPAGEGFARSIAKDLGAPIIHVPLEQKGADVQDWRRHVVASGGDWAQVLNDAVADALASQPMGVFSQLSTWLTDAPPLEWIINDVWAHPGVYVLGARPKMLKSWVAMQLALCLATGRPLFDQLIGSRRLKVAVILAEGNRRALGDRLQSLARGLGIEDAAEELNRHIIVADESAGVNISDDDSWARMEADLIQSGVEFVVLDTLRAVAPGLQENDAAAVSEMLARVRRLKGLGISVLLVHHNRKSSSDLLPSEALSGSGAIFGGVDGAALITDRQDRTLTLSWEARDGEPPEEMRITLDAPDGRFDGTAAARFIVDDSPFLDLDDEAPRPRQDDLATRVVAYIRQHGDVRGNQAISTEVEICEALGLNLGSFRSPGTRAALAEHPTLEHVSHNSPKGALNSWAIPAFLSDRQEEDGDEL